MVQNWTDRRVVIAPRNLEVSSDQRSGLAQLGVPLHTGDIAAIDQVDGRVSAVTLDSGEVVEVETLLWTPPEAPTALIYSLVEALGLELDEHGYVTVESSQQTNVDRLWAAGDVQGWMGAIESANAGGMAAAMIVQGWFHNSAEATA